MPDARAQKGRTKPGEGQGDCAGLRSTSIYTAYMSVADGSFSYEDVACKDDGKLYELIHGELVEKKTAFNSLWIATQIASVVISHARQRKLGWAAVEPIIACFPWLGRHARRPDVGYWSMSRLPSADDTRAALPMAPELAVEVLSPSNLAFDLDEKIAEYFQADVLEVWVVNPHQRTVRVLFPDGTSRLLTEGQTLTSETIPGFQANVADFFPPKAEK